MNRDVHAVGFAGVTGASAYRRRFQWVRLAVGATLLAVGVGAVAVGVIELVDSASQALDGTVATGAVAPLDGGRGAAAEFVVPPDPEGVGAEQTFTIYLLVPGGFSDSSVTDTQIGGSVCTASLADGRTATVRGSRQAVATEGDRYSSIGWFGAPPGPTSVRCEFTEFGARRNRDRLDDDRDFAVVPGRPEAGASGFVALFGGIAIGLLGGALAVSGARGRVVRDGP